jgi:hypothetical protein
MAPAPYHTSGLCNASAARLANARAARFCFLGEIDPRWDGKNSLSANGGDCLAADCTEPGTNNRAIATDNNGLRAKCVAQVPKHS